MELVPEESSVCNELPTSVDLMFTSVVLDLHDPGWALVRRRDPIACEEVWRLGSSLP